MEPVVPTKYVRSIFNDFPNKRVNTSDLQLEISNSAISVEFSHIETAGDICNIWFKNVLSASDETTLDATIATHAGNPREEIVKAISIREESIGTGGHFCTRSIDVEAAAGSTGTVNVHWPYPISALSLKLVTSDPGSTDKIDMTVGANTTIGLLTGDSGANPPTWSGAQNYTVGQKVLYTDVVFGTRPYTCIVNTTNQTPLDKTYWRHGYEISVDSNVIMNSKLGYNISLDDGVNSGVVGEVIHKTANTIFVSDYPTIDFISTSPTYVKVTVYVLKDHFIGQGQLFNIGESKIGGSYVPTDTLIGITYKNYGTVTRRLLGFVEYLY